MTFESTASKPVPEQQLEAQCYIANDTAGKLKHLAGNPLLASGVSSAAVVVFTAPAGTNMLVFRCLGANFRWEIGTPEGNEDPGWTLAQMQASFRYEQAGVVYAPITFDEPAVITILSSSASEVDMHVEALGEVVA